MPRRPKWKKPFVIPLLEPDKVDVEAWADPEKMQMLCLSILRTAMQDLHGKPAGLTGRQHLDARASAIACADDWFGSRRTDYIFAFVPICDRLGVDPDAVEQACRRQDATLDRDAWQALFAA